MFLSWEEPDKFVRASLVYMQMNMVCFFVFFSLCCFCLYILVNLLSRQIFNYVLTCIILTIDFKAQDSKDPAFSVLQL